MAEEVVVVFGGSGMTGKAIQRVLYETTSTETQTRVYVFPTHNELDLRDSDATTRYLKRVKAKFIINLAVVVGGIGFAMDNKVLMLEDNLRLATSVVRAAHEAGVQKMVSVLSTRMFPIKHETTFDESALEDGPPHDTCAEYSYAKRALFSLCKAYFHEYGREYVCLTPPNLYGPEDKIDERAHVIAALIRKFYDAEASKCDNRVSVYGSGLAHRQFLYCDDLAKLILWALDSYSDVSIPLIVAGDCEIAIRDAVFTIATNFNSEIAVSWDSCKPDGVLHCQALNTRFRRLHPDFVFTDFKLGVQKMVQWYREKRASVSTIDGLPSIVVPKREKRALIIGVTGQDGCYLARFLLTMGYEVFGTYRRCSTDNLTRISDICDRITLLYADLTDHDSILKAVLRSKPLEVYNLAAQSHVGVSFELPLYTACADGLGTARIIEALHLHAPDARLYQASTSELFGVVPTAQQTVHTSFYPVSPYGIAKHYAYQMIRYARDVYGMFAVNGILFNHESEMRGHEFVTRRITLHVAKWNAGETNEPILLGNLNSKRDWGHAEEYVQIMWRLLQRDAPVDTSIGTGTCYTVRQFVEMAFAVIGTKITWRGSAEAEIGINQETSEILVRINVALYRPSEVDILCAVRSEDGPKMAIHELVERMVRADCFRIKNKLPLYSYVDGSALSD